MEQILIYGHKNPDTDTICSAISYAYLKNKLNIDAKAVRLGDINEETEYALKYFNVQNIDLIDNVSNKNIILVDHNERTQTADGFEEARVLELIDHHKISNFNVSEPLYARVEPVGCTATIIYKLFKENNVEIPKEIAGIMLSAIISDTLLFNSPTTTNEDVEIAKELEKIAEVDVNIYGLDMLKAGADLSKKTDKELLNMDMKVFNMNGKNIAIAQVNSFNVSEILDRKQSIIDEMNKEIKNNNLESYIFVITDVLKNDSTIIAIGNSLEQIEKAYNIELKDNIAILKGVVSRKKQIVPPLMKVF